MWPGGADAVESEGWVILPKSSGRVKLRGSRADCSVVPTATAVAMGHRTRSEPACATVARWQALTLPPTPSAQVFQKREIARKQSGLLACTPALELTLTRDGLFEGVKLLRIDQPDRPPSSRITRSKPLVVRPLAATEIVCVADVKRIVRTAQDIDPRHQTTMPSSEPPGQGLKTR